MEIDVLHNFPHMHRMCVCVCVRDQFAVGMSVGPLLAQKALPKIKAEIHQRKTATRPNSMSYLSP